VIWRFDPLILTDDISVDDLLAKVQRIGEQLKGFTEKLVFSYADIAIYKKVKVNLEKSGIPYHEWTVEQMDDFARRLSQMNKDCGWNYQLATCGEKIDIEQYGIAHNRCIDGDLIVKLAYHDKALMDFMKVKVQDMPAPTLFDDAEAQLPPNAIRCRITSISSVLTRKTLGSEPCAAVWPLRTSENITPAHTCANIAMPIRPSSWPWKIGNAIKKTNMLIP